MKIFLDTEFSDFLDPELISIGLVADDGSEFYGEVRDIHPDRCSPFVQTHVLPLLGRDPAAIYPRTGLRDALLRWLWQWESDRPVRLCFDYAGDWSLFSELVDDEVPHFIQPCHVAVNREAVRDYVVQTKSQQHHALHDARTLMAVFKSQERVR